MQSFGQRLGVGDSIVPCCRRIFLGVSSVNPVHLGRFEDHLRADFAGSECGSGIGGKKRIARARHENDHASPLHVAHGAATDEWLSDALNGYGGLHPGGQTNGLEAGLERHPVNDCGEHSHVVRSGPFHPTVTGREAAPDVPATDDNGHLHPE